MCTNTNMYTQEARIEADFTSTNSGHRFKSIDTGTWVFFLGLIFVSCVGVEGQGQVVPHELHRTPSSFAGVFVDSSLKTLTLASAPVSWRDGSYITIRRTDHGEFSQPLCHWDTWKMCKTVLVEPRACSLVFLFSSLARS